MVSSRAVNLGEAGVRASVHVVLVWEWVPSNLLGERGLPFRRTTPAWVSSMVVGRDCLGVGLPLVVAAFPLPRHAAGSECFAVTDGDGRADLADELLDIGGTGR